MHLDCACTSTERRAPSMLIPGAADSADIERWEGACRGPGVIARSCGRFPRARCCVGRLHRGVGPVGTGPLGRPAHHPIAGPLLRRRPRRPFGLARRGCQRGRGQGRVGAAARRGPRRRLAHDDAGPEQPRRRRLAGGLDRSERPEEPATPAVRSLDCWRARTRVAARAAWPEIQTKRPGRGSRVPRLFERGGRPRHGTIGHE